MKQFILTIFFLFTISISAQTFNVENIEKIHQLRPLEKKLVYLFNEGFVQENINESSIIKLVKKKFNKRTQSFDKEIITLNRDTITYSLNDPKKYIKFKKSVLFIYGKHDSKLSNSNKLVYNAKLKFIIFKETGEQLEKFYNFSFYQTGKE